MVLSNASTIASVARVDAMVSSDFSMVRRMLEVARSMGSIVRLLKSSMIGECVDGYWDEGVNCSSCERGSPLTKSSPQWWPAPGVRGSRQWADRATPPTCAEFHPSSDNSAACGNLTSPLETY